MQGLQVPALPESEDPSDSIRPRRPLASWLRRFVLTPAENVHTAHEPPRSWDLAQRRVCTAARLQTNSSLRVLRSQRARSEPPRARDQVPPPWLPPPWPAAAFL